MKTLKTMRLATLISLSLATAAHAQSPAASAAYPSAPIQLIVPFAAGGPSDVIARVVNEPLAKELNAKVVVLNKPGAGTAVGMQALAASKPDGYTIGLATSSLISNKYTGLAAVEHTKFTPLALLLNSPGAIAAVADGRWRSLRDLIKAARAQPNSVTIGNTGAGGTWELMGFIMKDVHRIPFTSVPYNGGAPMSVALLGSQIDAAIQSVSGWSGSAKAGRIRMLSIASDQRDRVFTTVPTFKEEGVDLAYGFWTGFLAPAGMPPEISQRLSDALVRISKSPAFQDFAEKSATNVEVRALGEFERFLKAEDDRMAAFAAKYRNPGK